MMQSVTIKKLGCGNHKAQKSEMMAAAARIFPHYDPLLDVGGDESDALLLLQIKSRGLDIK